MNDVNRVVLQGVVAGQPRVHEFEGGGRLVRLRLRTVGVRPAGDGSGRERTAWHDVAVRGPRSAADAEGFFEGVPAYVEGNIETREYVDRAGDSVAFTEVRSNLVRSVAHGKPDVNCIVLLGHVTEVSDLRQAGNGRILEFQVRTTNVWTGRDGERNTTHEDHHVAAWDELASTLRLHPGQRVLVRGELHRRRLGGEDERPVYRTEIRAEEVIPTVHRTTQRQEPGQDGDPPF